ncbi:hypothetical protein A8C32_10415 [Flavivirga aquatica]|uniref:Uncharacterized protein n=1 Tax=Flavivirga aquatica TaxID=1849968 RepID=A0A1E5TCS2_9FLAO|nr:hypothetical protein A8C32_10415 [Flavivirga aquatica]
MIYKYFGKSADSKDNRKKEMSSIDYKPKYKLTKDTFMLEIINKNPFKASKETRKVVATNKIKSSRKNKIKPKVRNVVWPKISYHGFVKGYNKTTRLILLKIDKKLYRKREKDKAGDITLIKAYNDSLIVAFNNINKTIKKFHE